MKIKKEKYIIGIDEVGRGPIAGPVAVCAFLIKDDSLLQKEKIKDLPKLKDSKKLSRKQREKWFKYFKVSKKDNLCDYYVSYVSANMIDKFGIVKCIQKALDKSLDKVIKQNHLNLANFTLKESYVGENLNDFVLFLDGGLYAQKKYKNQKTIIKGDELYPVISCASIVAKEKRDKIMISYAKIYPEYGFENHVGYGTKAHYEAIKKLGQTNIHRKTFIHK